MTHLLISPLRDLLVVRLRPLPEMTGSLHRVQRNEAARWADCSVIGPEVRDVQAGQGLLVNPLSGQAIGEDLLIPESAVLGYE